MRTDSDTRGIASPRVVAALVIALSLLAVATAPALAVGGDAAAWTPPNETTTTPTPSGNDTTSNQTTTPQSATGNATDSNDSAGPTSAVKRAELGIDQPHYVETPVKTERERNRTVYFVRGPVFEIQTKTISRQSVIRSGVVEDGATLSYDPTTDEYRLETGGQNGTFQLYWVVAETVAVAGSNETRTEAVRYEAVVQVERASYAHVDPSRLAQLQEDSANWSETKDTFSDVMGDAPIDEKLQRAYGALKFIVDPLGALQGDFVGAALILILTNGGRLLLAIIILGMLGVALPLYFENRKMKREIPEYDDLDTEKKRIWREKRERMLSEVDPEDIPLGPDETARLRRFGTNLKQILGKESHILSTEHVKRVFLQAMGQNGYHAEYRIDQDGSILQAHPVHEDGPDDAGLVRRDGGAVETDESDDEWETDSLENPSDELVAAIDWSEIDLDALDDSVDPADVDAPISSTGEGHDLFSQAGLSVPEDFESREQFARAMGKSMDYVLSHPYTDEDGVARPEMSVLTVLYQLSTIAGERYDIPEYRYRRNVWLWLANNLDESKRIDDTADIDGFADPHLDIDPFGGGGDAD